MIKAKKSLGQNFLIDKNIIDKIVNLIDIKDKNILEIFTAFSSNWQHNNFWFGSIQESKRRLPLCRQTFYLLGRLNEHGYELNLVAEQKII